jgi:type III secretion protein Q
MVKATRRMTYFTPDPAIDDARASAPHVPIAPLKLPAVSEDAARLARTLCDARLAGYLQSIFANDADAAFSANVIDRDAEVMKFADPAVLEISLGSQMADHVPRVSHVRIALDLRAYPSLAIAASPEHDVHATSTSTRLSGPTSAGLALRQAVAGVLLEPMLAVLTRAGLRAPYVTALRRGRLSAASSAALSFTLHGNCHDVLIATDSDALDQLNAAMRDYLAAPGNSPAASAPLTIPGSLIVGIKPLSVLTLESLDVGDVLLRALFPAWNAAWLSAAGTSCVTAKPRAIATWGTPGLTRLCAVVELQGRSPVIVKEPNMSEELDPRMIDAGIAVDPADNPIELGELELPVQFEIDTVALPLAQLASLGPGYIVELPVAAADAQLRLVAHGQTIGYGELVTVGEHLGIRITRMAHRHGTVQ